MGKRLLCLEVTRQVFIPLRVRDDAGQMIGTTAVRTDEQSLLFLVTLFPACRAQIVERKVLASSLRWLFALGNSRE